MTSVMASELCRVYVQAKDVLAESGLRAQLAANDWTEIEPCPARAQVAVLACSEVDDEVVARIAQIKDLGCVHVVIVASHVDDYSLERVVESGAAGILRTSDVSPELLADAAQAAISGGGSLPSDLVGLLLRNADHGLRRRLDPRRTGTCSLADREESVLRLMAEGYDTLQIAEELHYSERTIKGIVHGIIKRFGLRNRPHAVAYALRQGLI